MANDADGPLPFITDPREAATFGLLKKSRYNIFGKKTVFAGQIITTPQHHAGVDGGMGPYICTVRLIDPKMAHISYLPDPCDIATSADEALTTQLYALHLRVTIPVHAASEIPKVNDIIDVILEPGDNGSPFNLQLGKGGKLRNRPDPSAQVATAVCTDLASAFQGTAGGMPSGAPVPGTGGAIGFTGVGAAKFVDRKVGRRSVPYLRLPANLDYLDDDVKDRFTTFLAELKAAGYSVTVSSARRSPKDQLYQMLANEGAKPCLSNHQYGYALDISISGCNKSNSKNQNNKNCWNAIWTGATSKGTEAVRTIADRNKVSWAGFSGAAAGATKCCGHDPVHFFAKDKEPLRRKQQQACLDYYKGLGVDIENITKNSIYNKMRNLPDNLEVIGVSPAAVAATSGTGTSGTGT